MDLFDSTLINKFHRKQDLNALFYVTCNQKTEIKHFFERNESFILKTSIISKECGPYLDNDCGIKTN